MTGTASYSIAIDRASSTFDISADYYIPGYNDPETGEQFYETRWDFSFASPGSTSGNSGYGWDTGGGYLSIGFPSENTVSDGSADFYAVNNFTGEEARLHLHILNAGLAQTNVALAAAADDGDTILLGGAGNDALTGAGGNDVLDGGAGADALAGGGGNDRLDGGSGSDAMSGGAGDDTYYVDDAGDTIAEAEDGGHDTVIASVNYALAAHVEDLSLSGPGALDGTGNDAANGLYGNNAANTLSGLGGDDVIYGFDGNDTLVGGEGSDRLDGGRGDDSMTGGAGDDHYVVDSRGDRIIEGAGGGIDEARIDGLARYTLGAEVENLTNLQALPVFSGWGNALDNVLSGAAGTDRLFGMAGNDRLVGGDGNDWLEGGAGADQLVGGRGIDTASYAGAKAAVTAHLGGFPGAGDAAGDTYDGIENLVGSRFADSLTGNSGNNRIFGGAGDDSLAGGGGIDWLVGGLGADTLGGDGNDGASYAGSAAAVTVDLAAQTATGGDATGDILLGIRNVEGSALGDTLTGSDGANMLLGGGGADVIYGAGGDDVIRGGAGADVLSGGAGLDTLDYAGSAAAVTVDMRQDTGIGGDAQGDIFSGFERVSGSAHDDTLTADDGGRVLAGGAGADTITGGAGRDVVIGGAGADTMDGGAGNDTLSYATSRSYVSVDLDSGRAFGDDGEGDTFTSFENLRGGAGSDGLYGNAGRNVIAGGTGGDYIDGRGGNDVVIGGSGDDAFALGVDSGFDHIRDFTAGGSEDRLVITWDSRFDTFDEVIAVAVQQGADTLITLSAGIGVVLEGVDRASLTVDDFVF
ncbi:MAG: calcium-binding protein [Novosphingobium sp.]|uniref:calcium-binding protein n=1 Tax=Novosphingobium sp. TaxID=1874826 RepID=UPI00301A2EF2